MANINIVIPDLHLNTFNALNEDVEFYPYFYNITEYPEDLPKEFQTSENSKNTIGIVIPCAHPNLQSLRDNLTVDEYLNIIEGKDCKAFPTHLPFDEFVIESNFQRFEKKIESDIKIRIQVFIKGLKVRIKLYFGKRQDMYRIMNGHWLEGGLQFALEDKIHFDSNYNYITLAKDPLIKENLDRTDKTTKTLSMQIVTILPDIIMRLTNKDVNIEERVRNNNSSKYRIPTPLDLKNKKLERQLTLYSLTPNRTVTYYENSEHKGGTKIPHLRKGYWRTSKKGVLHWVKHSKINGGVEEATYLSTDASIDKLVTKC